ncbi:MAG TPA: VWA domain-containing protein [Blastocatellia bacterium]|nr:VWA domain-containing protein [Blastocatellia bacterium]
MKGLNVRAVFALCLTLAVVTDLYAQSGRLRKQAPVRQHAADDDNDAVRLRVEEVLLAINVRNAFGKLPVDLKRTDFIVTEDGKRHEVNAVDRMPANILFILDTSGEHTLKNINLHRELALKMIEALGAEDRAAIISYGDTIQLLSAWTGDKAALRRALEWKFKPGIESDFYNSIIYGCDEVLSKVSGRRSIVLLTDGIDSYEKPVAEGATLMFEQALAALHRARATVYVAGQNEILLKLIKPEAFNALSWYERLDPLQRKKIDRLRRYYRQLEASELSLKGLAEETGGMAWMPASREAFTGMSNRMVEEIGTECVIAYSTERAADDAAFHSIKVYGTRADISIRFRRGLYANRVVDKTRGALSDLIDWLAVRHDTERLRAAGL